MTPMTIMQTLSGLGLDIRVSGENLVVTDELDLLTDEICAAIREHKGALIDMLRRQPYITCCSRCGGVNWGCVGTDHDILSSGEHRPYEVWGCLNCR